MFAKIIILFFTFILLNKCSSNSNIVIDPELFFSKVIDDSKVWLVEFYSPMCGSCQEFTETWNKIHSNSIMKSINSGKINIDNKVGLAIAKELGVLDQGIPAIRLFHVIGSNKGETIMGGEELSEKIILKKINEIIKLYASDDQGFLLKTL